MPMMLSVISYKQKQDYHHNPKTPVHFILSLSLLLSPFLSSLIKSLLTDHMT